MSARIFALFALLFAFMGTASAEVKIASVDFQRALDNVSEGATAKARLEGMFSEKKAALDKMKQQLITMQSELEKQSVILSDAARKQKEEEFYNKQAEFQQAYSRSEGEMQQAYTTAMENLIEKMKKISTTIATERGYTLVVEVNEGGVVYTSASIDITDELIKRYNAANPATSPKK